MKYEKRRIYISGILTLLLYTAPNCKTFMRPDSPEFIN
jgi:hypothetical protein